MQKFKNVNLEFFLEQVMKNNTKHHQEDFELDKKILKKAMESRSFDDKRWLWLSRENGTHCLKESEVFIKNTPSHNTWVYWAESDRDEKFIAFAINIIGKIDGKPLANIYELDYHSHVEAIKKAAVEAGLKVFRFTNGSIRLPDNGRNDYISHDTKYGEYLGTEHIANDITKHGNRISKMYRFYESLPEGDAEKYLSSLNAEPFHYVIWSNLNLDYEEGIKFARENYPDEPEDRLLQRYIEENDEILADERLNLDIQYNQPIIIIGDLGFWNGRARGYKDVPSGNIKDCLYSDTDKTEWFIDEHGDLRAEAAHHDGTNYYLYRVFKDNVTEEQIEDFKDKIYTGTLTDADIRKYTHRLGDEIAGVYGIDLPAQKKSVKKQLENTKTAIKKDTPTTPNKKKEMELE